MSNSTTATVETLTAEVRVLMVGSRQVTLSVYSQLDRIPHRRIDPFGRVNPRGADLGRVYVVGRDQETGVLVRAMTPHWDEELNGRRYRKVADSLIRTVLVEVKDDKSVTCAANVLARLACAGLLAAHHLPDHGRDLLDEAMRAAQTRNTAGHIYLSRRVKAIREGAPETEAEPGSHDEQAAELVVSYVDAIEKARTYAADVNAEWSALPLIVLAGLR